jgi:hypothetical protein
MVHGKYYGIQYEIHLNKSIDFYNDLLPIWMDVRARIEMDKHNNYKLIVIPYEQFNKQLINNSLFHKYVKENDEASYSHKEELLSKKFVMVTYYVNYIKHNSNLPEPFSEEEYKQLLEKWQRTCDILNENVGIINDLSQKEWYDLETARNEVFNKLKVQRIIHNKEFFEEIKILENLLINQVLLYEEHNDLIDKVINHPKIQGLISWHGLSLVSGFY